MSLASVAACAERNGRACQGCLQHLGANTHATVDALARSPLLVRCEQKLSIPSPLAQASRTEEDEEAVAVFFDIFGLFMVTRWVCAVGK